MLGGIKRAFLLGVLVAMGSAPAHASPGVWPATIGGTSSIQTFASQICFGVTSPVCISSVSGTGTVTSAGLALPASVFAISGSPVTTSGTLTATFNTQAAHQAFMGPVGGGPATPGFRAFVASDIPSLAASIITSGQGSLTTSTSGVTVTGTNAGLAAMTVDVGTATGSVPGLLAAADWTTFNNKQAGPLTGDVITSGAAATLASTAVTPGSYTNTNLTVDAKGRITAASTGSGGSGTVTSVSVVSANGLAGTVATATTTPAITLSTTITGLLKGNGTALSAATSGTDYSLGTSALGTGIVKSTTGTGALTIAVAGDFPTLNQNTTGSAALNVLKAGDTMTGALVLPAGSAAATALNGGTAGTGVFFPSSATMAHAISGTEVARFQANGLSINSTSALNALRVKNVLNTAAGGITFENSAGNRTIVLDNTGTNFMIEDQTGNAIFQYDASSYMGFSLNGGPVAQYSFENTLAAANSNPTLLSQLIPSSASFNLPFVMMQDMSVTAGTISGFMSENAARHPVGGIFTRLQTVTSGAEVAEVSLAAQNAGTLTELLRVEAKGQVATHGNVPAAGTCGTSPGTPTGNDNVFKITSGTGGVATTCAVTLNTTPTAGSCHCTDETSIATFEAEAVVSSNTVTISTFTRTTGLAAAFNASDVFSCACGYSF